MRILIVIAILFICFMGGVLYGMDNQTAGLVNPAANEAQAEINIDVNENNMKEQAEVLIPAETPVTPAYKVASALESVVNFFYEIIVEVLFQISKLFF